MLVDFFKNNSKNMFSGLLPILYQCCWNPQYATICIVYANFSTKNPKNSGYLSCTTVLKNTRFMGHKFNSSQVPLGYQPLLWLADQLPSIQIFQGMGESLIVFFGKKKNCNTFEIDRSSQSVSSYTTVHSQIQTKEMNKQNSADFNARYMAQMHHN